MVVGFVKKQEGKGLSFNNYRVKKEHKTQVLKISLS